MDHLVHVSSRSAEGENVHVAGFFLTISTRNSFTLLDRVLKSPILYCVVRKEGGNRTQNEYHRWSPEEGREDAH